METSHNDRRSPKEVYLALNYDENTKTFLIVFIDTVFQIIFNDITQQDQMQHGVINT